MAWVTEYDLTYRSNNATGDIFLQRDNGSYQGGLTLRRGSLEVRKGLPDWEAGVVRQNCSFNVVNDLSDFYELMPLMTISNGQIRVIVQETSPTTDTLFIGFLNPEVMSQDMLHNSDLRFTASGLLGKLEDTWPVEIETLQNMSLIDIIDDCLRLTGATDDIRVHCSLYELNSALSAGVTLFNRTALFTEITWKNNVDRLSALEILDIILTSFDCHLFWRESVWYIEHYQDLGAALLTPFQKTYVEYATGTSYEYGDSGSNQVVNVGAPNDIHDPANRPQIGGSQVLSVIPGLRELEIRLDQKQYFNLINGDLTVVTENTDAIPLAGNREWEANVSGSVAWYDHGLPFRNIANGIRRTSSYVIGVNYYGNGLTTSFRITVQDDTSLTLKWKMGVDNDTLIPGGSPLGDYTVTHHFWISFTIPWVSTTYVVWNESAGAWQTGIPGAPWSNLNTIDKSGSDFDSDLLTMEVSATIPVGEVFSTSASWEQDYIVNFGIGTEQYDDGVITPGPGTWCRFGDVEASISESPPNNILRGSQNTDFLDKKTINLLLFNSGWSYRNGLLRGSSLGSLYHMRATEWTYNGSDIDDLSKWLMASKFRLYNVARQKIEVTYSSIERFWPLGLWLDNKQSDKMFVLLSDIYYPEEEQHELILAEYDDTETINFV